MSRWCRVTDLVALLAERIVMGAHYVRDVKKELQAHIDELNKVIEEVDDEARVRVETIDRIRLVTVWKRRSFSREELAEHIAALQQRMDQATAYDRTDVEPSTDQQRKADLIQRLEKLLITLTERPGGDKGQ